jgi:hypothetical protein
MRDRAWLTVVRVKAASRRPAGQRNELRSSRFATSAVPVSSQNKAFNLSARLVRNTWIIPP